MCYNIPMKILVLSDTHGKLNMVRDIWPKLNGVDLVIHAGDYDSDAKAIQREFGVPVTFVKGNCDGCFASTVCDSAGGDYAIVNTEAGKILVTHGHCEHAGYSLDRLRYKALEEGCMAVVYGHTHVAKIEQTEESGVPGGQLWFINPGSLPLPRDGSGGSYGIIRASEDRFDATIVYYNTIMGNGRKTGGKGYVSSLLNYSDRF